MIYVYCIYKKEKIFLIRNEYSIRIGDSFNYQDKTIGIILCIKNNKFIMEYRSDERIREWEYDITKYSLLIDPKINVILKK